MVRETAAPVDRVAGKAGKALLGHASLNSTQACLGLGVQDLALMVERSQPRETARGGDDAVWCSLV